MQKQGETKTMADEPPQLGPRGGPQNPPCKVYILMYAGSVVFTAALFAGLYFLSTFLDREFPSQETVFTVAVTGVAGLDFAPDIDLPTSPTSALISPVFNLTFQVDSTPGSNFDACVPIVSRADVSYGGAFLAGGSFPPLCAREKPSDRVAARASGENVAVPRFLRDQLAAELAAGDASVDVKVTMPTYCSWNTSWWGGAVLSCKPKIGGGTSPACHLDLGWCWSKLSSIFQSFL